MKITPANITSFLNNPPASTLGVLIYGPDSGLISETLRLLSQKIVKDIHDPFLVTELPYDKIKDNPSLLADELASLSLMGGRRLIRIKGATASIPSAISNLLQNPIGDALVIITSGELPPSSSLRKLFETTNHLAALPCYKDEGAGLRSIIAARLKQHGFSTDVDVLALLSDLLAGDRLVILQEVDKLMLYMGDNMHIKTEDVLASMGEPLEVSLDALCMDIASGKTAAVQAQIDRLYRENTSPVTIIRAVSRYFMRLYNVKAQVTAGTAISSAIQTLKPPVFFKQIPLFTQQIHRWPIEKLTHAIRSLAHLEAECKKSGQPASLLCSRLMILLAYSTR